MEQSHKSGIEWAIELLSTPTDTEAAYAEHYEQSLPSIEKVKEIVDLLRSIIFPGYFGGPVLRWQSRHHFLGVRIEKLYALLTEQIYSVEHFGFDSEAEKNTGNTQPCALPEIRKLWLDVKAIYDGESTAKNYGEIISSFTEQIGNVAYCENEKNEQKNATQKAATIARQFIGILPEIRKKLWTDVKAIYDGDPAAKSYGEIIFCYPSIRAVINYRAAHSLLSLGVPLIPRIITEMAHSETGIDIHPGAHIGDYFCIDHGTGVVIGETCIIGDHVRLYQGVTLGAKKFELDDDGNPVKNLPRHPIIEDNVVIYSNANILGRITIGKNSVIGGNVWVTRSVPPNSRVLQQKAVETSFTDGLGI